MNSAEAQNLFNAFPEVRIWFKEEMTNYNDEWRNYQKQALAKVPLFSSLDDESYDHLILLLKEKRYEVGDYLFIKGEMQTAIYIIVQGEVSMLIPLGGTVVTLDVLYQDCTIGAVGAINGERYQLSSRVKSPC